MPSDKTHQADQQDRDKPAKTDASYEYGTDYQYGVNHPFSSATSGHHIHIAFKVVTDENKAVLRYSPNLTAPTRINYSDGSMREFGYDDKGALVFVREESGSRWTRQTNPDALGFADWKSDAGDLLKAAAFVSDNGVYAYVDQDGLMCQIWTDNKFNYGIYKGEGDPFAYLRKWVHRPEEKSSKPEHEVRALLARLFHSLDRDGDGIIHRSDLDNAVIDNTITGQQAQLLATLKLNFDKLSDQGQPRNHEQWQILPWLKVNFDRLIAMQAGHGLSVDQVVALSDIMSQHKAKQPAETAKTNSLSLYASGTPLDSITPKAVRQGNIGDCIFLAALGSVAACCPETILRTITENRDGTFTVAFAGARKENLTVPRPTATELSLYAHATKFGIWPAVLEKAYGLYLAKHGQVRSKIPSENILARDCAFESLDLLTGQMGRWETISSMPGIILQSSLISAFSQRRAMVAASKAGGKDGRTSDAGIPGHHAYSIIAFDAQTGTVSLRNPWGNSQPGEASFTMSLAQFRNNFAHIYYEVWAPTDGINDEPPQPRDALISPRNQS